MAVLAFALPSGASALELGKIEEFTGAAPTNLVAGPEGNVWFTDLAAGKVGRVTPGGTITEYVCPGCSA
jgi:virginiamycin B lyase